MPVLVGSALAVALLVLLATTTAVRERAPANSIRAASSSEADDPQVCVTESGFCPLEVTVPDGQPCRCVDAWRGAVAGRAWSLHAILDDPGLLPDRLEDDPDE